MNSTADREDALTMYGFMDGQTTREDGASRASVASICRYWADETFDNLDGEATAALRFCLTRAAELLTVPTLDAGKVFEAEEQVRQDAADRMQHTTTSDLSARLMCRVGFRELTLLLAHYDGLKQAHADKPLRIPVELDEAKLPGAPQ